MRSLLKNLACLLALHSECWLWVRTDWQTACGPQCACRFTKFLEA